MHAPEWQWQRARQKGCMEGREIPIKEWPRHRDPAKHAGRMCTSLVGKCWSEPGQAEFFEARGKAHKSASQGAMLIYLHQEMEQGSKTAEVSSK